MIDDEYLLDLQLVAHRSSAVVANAMGNVYKHFPVLPVLNSGEVLVLGFTTNVTTIILDRLLTPLEGVMQFEVITGAVETAVGTPVQLYQTNTTIPVTLALNSFRTGVTIEGGTVIDIVEVSAGSPQSSRLPDRDAGGRFLGAGSNFWLRLTGKAANSRAKLEYLFAENVRLQ